jgi:putative SOS response-associated peptidase YedK
MCGRYRLSRRKQEVEEYFDVCSEAEEWNPFYNIAPTRLVPVIRQHPREPHRDLSLLRWGLIPSWSKETSAGASTINARSETAASLPAYREPLRFRRCLVPADGFYEWKRTAAGKQPYCFEVSHGELFAFAGVWDGWRGPDNQWIRSFSILTTAANTLTAPIHDRMPVIVAKENYDLWLDPEVTDVRVASDLLRPYNAAGMRCYPVSERVNHVQNDDAECAKPITPEAPPQGHLFG